MTIILGSSPTTTWVGTLTLSELKEEVRAGLGGRTELDSRLTRFLNMAQDRIARMKDFEEMQTSVNGNISNTGNITDRVIEVPEMRKPVVLWLTATNFERKLTYKPYRRFVREFANVDSLGRGEPCNYTVWAKKIRLDRLPNQTYSYQFDYTFWPTRFSDSDPDAVSDLHKKDDAIIELALCYAMYSLGREQEAQQHEARGLILAIEGEEEDSSQPDLDVSVNGRGSSASDNVSEPWADPFISSWR